MAVASHITHSFQRTKKHSWTLSPSWSHQSKGTTTIILKIRLDKAWSISFWVSISQIRLRSMSMVPLKHLIFNSFKTTLLTSCYSISLQMSLNVKATHLMSTLRPVSGGNLSSQLTKKNSPSPSVTLTNTSTLPCPKTISHRHWLKTKATHTLPSSFKERMKAVSMTVNSPLSIISTLLTRVKRIKIWSKRQQHHSCSPHSEMTHMLKKILMSLCSHLLVMMIETRLIHYLYWKINQEKVK